MATNHIRIETGYHTLIDSHWFLTVAFHDDETVTVIEYKRDHIATNRDMRHAYVVEGDKRIVTHVDFDGSSYKVRNPMHVFDYK